MRRNFIIRIAVAPAVLSLLVVAAFREQNRPATGGTGIAQVARNPADALHIDARRSLPNPASPAKLSFTHLSVANGLSHADVRAIAQDKQGFMWFGTWLGGLNRYDGYTFKVYRHDDQDQRSIACDTIWALYVDRAGVLWVGTQESFDRYDRDTDSFVHYRHRADDATSLPGYQARSIFEDESGTLWISTSGALSRFDRTTGRFFTYRQNLKDPTTFGDTDVQPICLNATTGMLWVPTWHRGVSLVDPSTGHFTRYRNNPNDPGSLSTNDILNVYQDRKGNLWFSTMRGLNRFDPKNRIFIRYLHDPSNAASLSDDYSTRRRTVRMPGFVRYSTRSRSVRNAILVYLSRPFFSHGSVLFCG
jgi:ligand-binding sensor domain-containing protein